MAESLRRTISHAAVYGFGTMAANAASLVMLPIYTRYLAPKDYGLLEMLQMLTDVASILFGMRVTAGVFRIYFDSDNEDRRKTVMSTAWITDIAMHALGALVLVALAVPAARVFLGSDSFAPMVAWFAGSLVTMAMIAMPMGYLRALQKPWAFVTMSLVKLLLQVALNVYFVVHLQWGPSGVVASTLITGVLVGGGLSIWLFRTTGLQLDLSVSKRMVSFGAPLALAGVGAFYTNYGDRFFLQHYWGLAEVGLYALAYRFAFALSSLVYGTFDQAWSAQSFVVYKQANRDQMFSRAFLLIMLAMIFVGTAISVMARDIVRVMSAESFSNAWLAIPPLVAAYILRAASDFCGFGIRLSEQTRQFLWASIISVAVMTVGYVGFIPRWGAVGAAFATLAGMYAELWWTRRAAHRLIPLRLPWPQIIAAAIACTSVFLVSLLLPSEDLVTSIASRSVLLLLTGAALFFSPIVGASERAATVELLRDGMKKLRPA